MIHQLGDPVRTAQTFRKATQVSQAYAITGKPIEERIPGMRRKTADWRAIAQHCNNALRSEIKVAMPFRLAVRGRAFVDTKCYIIRHVDRGSCSWGKVRLRGRG
jgi:hypothetical protein